MKQRTFTTIVKEELTRYGGIAFCIIAAVCFTSPIIICLLIWEVIVKIKALYRVVSKDSPGLTIKPEGSIRS